MRAPRLVRTRRAAVATLFLAIAVAGCGDDDDDASDATEVESTEAAADETTAEDEPSETTEPEATEPEATAVETTEVETTEGETTEVDATAAPVPPAPGFPFVSPDGDYTITMPGEPTPAEQTASLPDGTSVPFTFYLYEEGDFAAGVTRIDYAAGSQLSLEGARDGAVANIPDAELVASEPITLQGRDGLEFVASIGQDGGAGYYLSRIYGEGTSLFQVVYVGDVSIEDPEVAAFFDSFQFTP